MASIGSWHDPFVVRFMKMFVNQWVVQAPVDEVDEAIGECNE